MPFKLIFIVLFLTCTSAFAQVNKTAIFHLEKEQVKVSLTAKKNLIFATQQAVNQFRISGYVGITLSDSTKKKQATHYYFKSRKHFKKVALMCTNRAVETNMLNAPGEINRFLIDLENSGYPFASLQFIKQQEKENAIDLFFKIDSGQFMTIGEIIIKSPHPYHQNTIQNLIHIKPGQVYNESKIKNISESFAQGNFYELIRAPELLFRENSVDVYLTIKKRNTSVADGFIGFQQNSESLKLELNGNLNLGLNNGLNRGEILDFKWQSNPNKSQNLDIEIAYPYIVNLPVGLSGLMTIQKQDTSFIRNSFFGSIKYLASNYSIGIFGQSENSFLLGESNSSTLNFAAFKRNTVGFDGTINPKFSSAYRPFIKFKIGAFSLNSDSVSSATSSSNLLLDVSLTQRVKLVKYFYYSNTLRFQDIRSNQQLTKNQLFYFGGLKSVRGFYELELNGNHVFSVNNAIMFKPVKQLSFELIYDYSQFHSSSFTQTHSVGIGFNIENETNTLSLILANGTITGNNFNFQNSKLHLGFISRF